MNKKVFITMLAFVFVGMTNVMAGTSKDEKAEGCSVDKTTATEYYLEAAGGSGSGLFRSIELLSPSRQLRIVTERGGHVEINCSGHGIVPDDRLFYTADSNTGEIITEPIYTEFITVSTSKRDVSITQYETRIFYIRER